MRCEGKPGGSSGPGWGKLVGPTLTTPWNPGYLLRVRAIGLSTPCAYIHGHPIEVFTAWLPPWSLDGNDTVGGTDAITGAKGGCAGRRGALLTVGQLLSQPALQRLLW